MESKHKKILLICVAVFIGSYVVRYVGNAIAFTIWKRQQAEVVERRKAWEDAHKKATEAKKKAEDEKKQAEVKPPATAPPPPPEPLKPDPVFQAIRGHWAGNTAILRRGIFRLDLQLEDGKDTGQYQASLKLRYVSAIPARGRKAANDTVSKMDPEPANLTGTPENGELKLTLAKKLGTLQGCAVSGATITPFGPNEIHIAWTEDKCAGGYVIARRLRI